jgi:hypothetical protein
MSLFIQLAQLPAETQDWIEIMDQAASLASPNDPVPAKNLKRLRELKQNRRCNPCSA